MSLVRFLTKALSSVCCEAVDLVRSKMSPRKARAGTAAEVVFTGEIPAQRVKAQGPLVSYGVDGINR
jgi:hypothetical protein